MGGFCGVGYVLFLDLGGGFINLNFFVHFSVYVLFHQSEETN